MHLRERLTAHFMPLFLHIERRLGVDLGYLVKGNVWLTVSQVVSNLSGIALTIAFANLLSPASYGFFKYIISLTGVIGAFTLTGLGPALINSVARGDEGIIRATFWSSIRWSLPVSAVALAATLYYLVNDNYALGASLAIFAICNPWLSAFGNYRQIFPGKKDFKGWMFYSIPRSVFPVLAILPAIVFTDNPTVVVFAYFLANTLTVAILAIYIVRHYQLPKTANSLDTSMTFAKKTSVLAVFSTIAGQIDQLLVWHFVGPVAVAMYSLATSPVEQIQSLTGNVFSLAAPKFATKDPEELRKMVPKRIKQMFLIVIPVVVLYIAAAPLIFRVFFPKYVSVVFYTQIYSLVLLLQPQGFIDAAFVAAENVGIRAKVTAAAQVVRIGLLIFGIWRYGILGGIVAGIVAEIITLVIGLIALQYQRRITPIARI